MTDPLPRAYAQLGVPLGTSPAHLRRRYRELVRRWHPDRFASDPRAQAEAALQMREINAAYRLILASRASRPSPAAGSSPPPPRAPEAPLTRDEIERMVRAVGTDGPVEIALDSLRSLGKIVGTALGAAFLIVLAFRLAVAVVTRDWTAIRVEPRTVVPLALGAAVLLLAWSVQREGRPRRPTGSRR